MTRLLTPGAGRRAAQRDPTASVLLAPNPSPMTLEGTNTWLLRGAGAQRSTATS